MLKKILLIPLILLSVTALAGGILFDSGHGQTAGNADWTVNGAYSDFADALKHFFDVSQTYGTISPSLLNRYDVLIVPEPNEPFSPDEQSSILDFIKDGGGVFFIADHEGADRNRNGWDAVSIFDEFVGTLGIEFNRDNMTAYPAKYVMKSPITEGVSKIGEWAGSTLSLSKEASPAVELYTHQVYAAYGRYGKGRFVAIGDSSPFDDGTGAPGKELYDGWHTGDDAVFAVNSVYWLAGKGSTNTSVYFLPPKVERIEAVSAKILKIYFDKKIKGNLIPRFNVAVIGSSIDSVKAENNVLTVVLSEDLTKGKHTVITRNITDFYGNASPLVSSKFDY